MTRLLLALALLVPISPAMPPAPRAVAPKAARRPEGYTWVATWYGQALHGRYTAWHFWGRPGTRFDARGMTCAHPSLPFGTRLKVTRKHRTVEVIVTDRGPLEYTGADLDLSFGAARRLGIVRLGRAVVQAEVMP